MGANRESGPVAVYQFSEGSGTVVRDKSGHGNDGRIVGNVSWAKEGLVFDGQTYVEVGATPSLELSRAGTLAVWCKPEAIEGGLISWHLGSRWIDARLVLAFITYYDSRLIGVMSDGTNTLQVREMVEAGEWAHLVLRFDGANMQLFVNGKPTVWRPQGILPDLKGVPLRIGVTDGLGKAHFRGMIGEVRIYSRALANEQISQQFREGARALGLKKSLRIRLAACVRPRSRNRSGTFVRGGRTP